MFLVLRKSKLSQVNVVVYRPLVTLYSCYIFCVSMPGYKYFPLLFFLYEGVIFWMILNDFTELNTTFLDNYSSTVGFFYTSYFPWLKQKTVFDFHFFFIWLKFQIASRIDPNKSEACVSPRLLNLGLTQVLTDADHFPVIDIHCTYVINRAKVTSLSSLPLSLSRATRNRTTCSTFSCWLSILDHRKSRFLLSFHHFIFDWL